MDSSSSRSLRGSATDGCRQRPTDNTQRYHRVVFGFVFKTTWHPYQQYLKVAKHLIDNIEGSLPEVVEFRDPPGNVSRITVRIRSGRHYFTHGLGHIWQFYELDDTVNLFYAYLGNGKFNIRINRINGLDEILYPHPPLLYEQPTPHEHRNNLHVPGQPPQQQDNGLLHDPEEVLGVPRCILWKNRLTHAHTRGRQGLVLPVRIVTTFLQEDQQIIQIKLPSGEVKQ
ncbi:DNA-binding barrel domain superfamily [Sesbania bispinosa]|nr:DNA-binding barrel domain superfamily [Sesbania bispinosa]